MYQVALCSERFLVDWIYHKAMAITSHAQAARQA